MPNVVGTRVLEASLLLAGLGFAVSRWSVLVLLQGLDPTVLFLLWYAVLYAFLQVASIVLFRSFGFTSLRVGFGLLLIWFAAGIVFYWPSSVYVEELLRIRIPNLALATEDQLTAVVWQALGVTDVFTLGLVTYVLTPFFLSLSGFTVLGQRRALNAMHEIFTPETSGGRSRAVRAFAALFDSSDGMHHVRAKPEP